MATRSIDFSTYPVEDPLSGGGVWTAFYNGGMRIVDNGGTNMLFNDTSGDDGHMIDSGTATYGRKQYVEMEVRDTLTTGYSNLPAVYCSSASGGNAYHLRASNTWSAIRFYSRKAGVPTNLANASLGTVVSGDVVGLLAEDDGSGDTTLTAYLNPSTYDGDGFPTNGSQGTHTDTTSPLTSGQTGVYSFGSSTSPGSYAISWYAAGEDGGGGGGGNNGLYGGMINGLGLGLIQ